MADKGGRPITLTKEIGGQLEALWRLSGDDTLTDKEIAERLGITYKQITGWLDKNTKWIVRIDESGKKLKSKNGLRVIRTQAKASTKSSYLATLYDLMTSAKKVKDYKTAANIIEWLLEKQFPNEFGNRLKILAKVEPGKDMRDMTDGEIKAQFREDLTELMRRPECQEIVKQLMTPSTG